MRSEILPRSPVQSTVLFSSGRGGGQGERRKHQWPPLDHHRILLISVSLWIFQCHCSVTRGRLIFTGCPTWYRHLFTNVMEKKANCSAYFNVMRLGLVEWNNPELQWNIISWLTYPQIQSLQPWCKSSSLLFLENLLKTSRLKKLLQTCEGCVSSSNLVWTPPLSS